MPREPPHGRRHAITAGVEADIKAVSAGANGVVNVADNAAGDNLFLSLSGSPLIIAP